MNWSSVPLRSFDTMMRYIEGTQTDKGLGVKTYLKRGGNETDERVPNEELAKLNITPHDVCPARN